MHYNNSWKFTFKVENISNPSNKFDSTKKIENNVRRAHITKELSKQLQWIELAQSAGITSHDIKVIDSQKKKKKKRY